MRSTLNPRPADDPHDFVVVPPDMVRVVPSDDELSHVLRDAARHLGDTQAHAEPDFVAETTVPAVDTTFRATAVDDLLPAPRSPFGNLALRGFTAFAFAAFTAAAGIAWQFYGGPAKQVIANWTPLALTSSQASEESAQGAQPAVDAAAPAVDAAAANEAPAQAAPAAPTAAEVAANAAAALSPDQSKLQSMARDLASAGQQIEQLKASIAELKAGQQQISRELAKASERPRASPPHAAAPAHAPPPHQAAARAYPPAAAPYMPPPPQAAAPPPADPSVPRPPMPVR
jgi:pyruvate/2-oxoglutarate dehydrogenase complex dihydrolipoamide acyltransferase (E2) component